MSKWYIEEDEDYFRIFDSKKEIAGYFDPEYGQNNNQNESEEIERIVREHIPVPGGYLMVPFVKFGIFDTDYESDLNSLEEKIESVITRIKIWKIFIAKDNMDHQIRISHTDHDMLSITFPVKFEKPIPVDKKLILPYLEPMLETLSRDGLL
ncbi:MAG: hypothetical protein K8823_1475 [Cenarchaeum symbiont of Oopsacas minuta]|nr:hypothetical protein [Cenarchaeum symbiont of Oopsacas minuta]